MDRRRMAPARGSGIATCRLAASLGLLLALGPGSASARTEPAKAPRDSLTALPFLPASGAGEQFTASRLTKAYDHNLMQFVKPVRRVPPTELAGLDGLAASRPAPPDTAPVDSSDIRLTRAGQGQTAELTPEQKAALVPEQPGAHVGIPGPVAATTALLGGLALFVKLLTELIR